MSPQPQAADFVLEVIIYVMLIMHNLVSYGEHPKAQAVRTLLWTKRLLGSTAKVLWEWALCRTSFLQQQTH
ncbi:hypothetical protein KY290_036954 [Solanum tuberosum]|uniref:Uncharacterized protein n=1 Tax=Solanum tuberosum TaxID=4113 RepID=A0ABQ7TU48_SOLTU|nr:hypothetical protein KY290_036954 [Solanum tuberosum]